MIISHIAFLLSRPDFAGLLHIDEKEDNRFPYNTIKSLESSITGTMSQIDRDNLIWTCQDFGTGFEAVIEADD